MPQKFQQHTHPVSTPQSEPIPNAAVPQVPNSAGGFAWEASIWSRLLRFLILGTEGGTYYIGEAELTRENAQAVQACLDADPHRAISTIVDVSMRGRAPKNDAALFALAMAASHPNDDVRRYALSLLASVARTGTHLFTFLDYVTAMRGWGRGLRYAVRDWYGGKDTRSLATQFIKYPSRGQWSHRDLYAKVHPEGTPGARGAVVALAVNRGKPRDKQKSVDEVLEAVPATGGEHVAEDMAALEQYMAALKLHEPGVTAKDAAKVIALHKLPREAVPTELLTEPVVWEALLPHMPMTAMIRNLGTMTRLGLLDPMKGEWVKHVREQVTDAARLRKARVHPITILAALTTYAQGHGQRGGHAWTPVQQVVDALDAAFYLAFQAVEPTGKRFLLALDVSGSMGSGWVSGVPGLTPRVASAAMAMVTARTEDRHQIVGFTSGAPGEWRHGKGESRWTGAAGFGYGGYHASLLPLELSPRKRLDDVCRYTEKLPMGGTDCALPMLYAREKSLEVDVFVVYTDSETWAGSVHPSQALKQYRQASGIDARLVVCAMTGNKFTIADPSDPGMLDVVGFDVSVPGVLAAFAKGEL